MTKTIKVVIIFLLIITAITLYAKFIGVTGLITKEYTILEENLPKSYNGLKIVHFSDLHYGNIIKEKNLKQIKDEINLINPDIVIFTGDLFEKGTQTDEKTIKKVTKLLKEINAKYGKYSIFGNHDYDEGIDKIESIYKKSDFTILNNTYDLITNQNNDKIYLGGIDDTILGNPNTKILEYLKENENIYSIVLVHEPDYTTTILKNQKVNIILAGHSHNGQVRLPVIGAIYTPKGAKRYYENHYKIENTELYISSGIGNSKLNLRLFNHPSINFYRINKKDS